MRKKKGEGRIKERDGEGRWARRRDGERWRTMWKAGERRTQRKRQTNTRPVPITDL